MSALVGVLPNLHITTTTTNNEDHSMVLELNKPHRAQNTQDHRHVSPTPSPSPQQQQQQQQPAPSTESDNDEVIDLELEEDEGGYPSDQEWFGKLWPAEFDANRTMRFRLRQIENVLYRRMAEHTKATADVIILMHAALEFTGNQVILPEHERPKVKANLWEFRQRLSNLYTSTKTELRPQWFQLLEQFNTAGDVATTDMLATASALLQKAHEALDKLKRFERNMRDMHKAMMIPPQPAQEQPSRKPTAASRARSRRKMALSIQTDLGTWDEVATRSSTRLDARDANIEFLHKQLLERRKLEQQQQQSTSNPPPS